MFPNEVIRSALSVDRELIILQVVSGEALVPSGVDGVEDCKWETRESSHMHLVWSSTCSGADRVVVGKFDMGEMMGIPVALPFVDFHTT